MFHTTGRKILWLTLIFALLAGQAQAGSNLLFELTDPRGDDHGDGGLIYPSRTDFERGDLDLTSVKVRAVNGGTRFDAYFAKPIRVAEREAIDELGTTLDTVARHGFYTFNIDIYIDMDRKARSGGVAMLPGRKAEIHPDHAWDRAIIVTPRPHAARASLERVVIKTLANKMTYDDELLAERNKEALRGQVPSDLDQRVFFPNQIRVRGNRISFFVPDEFLGAKARPDWSYVIAVSGADLIQSLDLGASLGLAESTQANLMILPISPGAWRNRFGGGRENGVLQPPLVDILVPNGDQQEHVLSNFSSTQGRPATLVGVIPSEAQGAGSNSAVGAGRR